MLRPPAWQPRRARLGSPSRPAAIGVLAALIRFGPSSEGVVTAALLGSLGVLAVIDFREQVVPNRIVLPAAALVLGLQLALFSDQALEWVLAVG